MLVPLSPQDIPWIIDHMQAYYSPAYKYLWEDDGDWYVKNMYNSEKLREEFTDPNASFYRVADDRSTYGYCKTIAGKGPDRNGKFSQYLYLQRLYLATHAQGKGVGTKVMHLLIEQARQAGYDAMWLETMEVGASRRFYERFGFEEIYRIRLPFPGMQEELRGLLAVEMGVDRVGSR